jgi:hypothetical protein
MNPSFFRKFATGFTALYLMSAVALPIRALAETELDFKLINDTGHEINSVYLAPSGSEEWGDDILGKGVRLGDGESTDITFSRAAEKMQDWHLMVQFNDGSTMTWADLDLTGISELTLHYKKGKATATWE